MSLLRRFAGGAAKLIPISDYGVSVLRDQDSRSAFQTATASVSFGIYPDRAIKRFRLSTGVTTTLQNWLSGGSTSIYSARFVAIGGTNPSITRGTTPTPSIGSLNTWYNLSEYLTAGLTVTAGNGIDENDYNYDITTFRVDIARTSDTSIILDQATISMEVEAIVGSPS